MPLFMSKEKEREYGIYERKEKNVNQKPTTTPSSERVILGIEDMSRTIGMALAGFGAIMLTALIWLYLRSKKA